MEYDFKQIEEKWQKEWEKAKAFEPKVDKKKKKFFFTTPYPYISGSLHLGHGRAVTESDIYCRYMRMKGFNVLYPLAFHITGTPVLGISSAIEKGDKSKIDLYKGYVKTYVKNEKEAEKVVKSFKEPWNIVDFFVPKMMGEYSGLGVSVDWTRRFTTGDKDYQKFITWQFNQYKDKNYLIKGSYPVLFCPNCDNAVGEDDIQDADSDPVSKQEFMWIKFKMVDSDWVLMAGTTRPDALYGQTHLWIDPNGEYVLVKVKGENWVVGSKVLDKIEQQFEKPEIIRKVSPKELIGKWVKGPLVNYKTHILPAWFIDSGVGSGIVYSALEDPVDLYELEKIQANLDLVKEFSLDLKEVKRLKPIDIIEVPGMGTNLGKAIGNEFGVRSSEDKDKIELAKSELNKRVFRKGIMRNNCGKCSGMSVQKCQEYLKAKLVEDNEAIMFYEPSREAYCRCGGKVVVSILNDQWFLDFNAKGWKEKAYECLKKIELLPETLRKQFEDTFEWLDKRPCARKRGLGTPLPFDKDWIIESLSDSTIYMTFYTIKNLINKHKIKPEQLTLDFFDYVYLGKGKVDELSKKTKISESALKELREAFDYWYPNDHRHTFILHLSNHLSFMMFAHSGIFPEKYWPKKISFHGLVVSEGTKMSKSKGNVITLLHVKENYGADVFRFYLTSSTNLFGTFDWREIEARAAKLNVEKLYRALLEASGNNKKGEVKDIYVHKFNLIKKNATEALSQMKLREYNNSVVYDMLNLVRDAKLALNDKELAAFYDFVLRDWLKLVAPVCPHIAEEIWHNLGNKSFISLESWPEVDEGKIDEKFEQEEKNQDKLVEDIKNIIKILEAKGQKDIKEVKIFSIPKEIDLYKESKEKLEKIFNMKVEVLSIQEAGKTGKKIKAVPGKPGILIE